MEHESYLNQGEILSQTDWDYGEPHVRQVVPVEVTITKWKEVK